jgi:putative transposase
MGRRRRCIIPGERYHITHRGNHREAILSDDESRAMYMSIMRRWQLKTGMEVGAITLMPNHVHAICQSPDKSSLSTWIKHGHRDFSTWLNIRRGTTGHNWEGRFFSVLMDDEHTVNALRYVEQNPVAARMVHLPWEWHWSSAAYHCGLGPKPEIINVDLRPAGTTASEWRDALRQPSSAEFRVKLRECSLRRTALAGEEWTRAMELLHGIELLPKERGRKQGSLAPK